MKSRKMACRKMDEERTEFGNEITAEIIRRAGLNYGNIVSDEIQRRETVEGRDQPTAHIQSARLSPLNLTN